MMQGGAAGNLVVAAGDEPAGTAVDTAPSVAGLLCRPAAPAALRLPLLSRLIDGWPAAMAGKLATGWSLEVALRRLPLRMERLSTLASGTPGNALVARLRVNGLPGLVSMDRVLVLWLIDRMLGGRGLPPAPAALERPLTLIEKSLMQPVICHAGEALAEALASVGALTLSFEGWAEDRAALAQPAEGDAALVLGLEGRPGETVAGLTLALPLAGLEPLRAKLAEAYPGAALGHDRQWRRHMAAVIGRSRTALTAVLHETELPLSRIGGLAVGETLVFDVGTDPLVELRAGAVRLGAGRLGRSNGRIAIRLETVLASAGETLP